MEDDYETKIKTLMNLREEFNNEKPRNIIDKMEFLFRISFLDRLINLLEKKMHYHEQKKNCSYIFDKAEEELIITDSVLLEFLKDNEEKYKHLSWFKNEMDVALDKFKKSKYELDKATDEFKIVLEAYESGSYLQLIPKNILIKELRELSQEEIENYKS